jgi:hypothetical protein
MGVNAMGHRRRRRPGAEAGRMMAFGVGLLLAGLCSYRFALLAAASLLIYFGWISRKC